MSACEPRKDDTPAYLHPIRVALTLARFGCDEETIVVGLLHDVIEDAQVTYDEIKDLFSKEIADLVQSLSHEKGEKIRETIDRVRLAGERSILVKLADNSDNIRTIEYFTTEKQPKYLHYATRIQELGENMLGQHPLVLHHRDYLKEAFKKVAASS